MNWTYIDTPEALQDCTDFLHQQPTLALDLEFDKNRYRYGFNLCLIQLAAGDRCYLIDPLIEELDLQPLFRIFEDPNNVLIVYSFSEDLRLFHSLGCFPQNTYDLVIAMRLLDYAPMSLGNALLELIDIEISKSAQKSNWFTRPLSKKQLDYAANDVLYLHDLYNILCKKVQKQQIEDWVKQENSYIDSLSFVDINNNSYLKEKDKYGLSEHEFYIFKGLLEFREQLAKENDRPSYQMIDKEYLRELAQRPNQIHRFEKIRGIFRTLKNETFKEKLWAHYQQLAQTSEREGYSKTTPAIPRMSQEAYQAKRRLRKERDEIKKKLFKPIQERIAEDFGRNIITYLMSNRFIDELIVGNTEQLRPYRKAIIQQYGDELNLPIQPYLKQ